MDIAWKPLNKEIQSAVHQAQLPWLGTRYSSHQREIGGGVSCYGLVAEILDTLYRRDTPTELPLINTNAGMCNDAGAGLVSSFLRGYPLDSVMEDIEPGDLVVTRSVPGLGGPSWMGHVMMAGARPGLAIHAMPATGVAWGSFVSSLGRIVRVYRPRDKESWIHVR